MWDDDRYKFKYIIIEGGDFWYSSFLFSIKYESGFYRNIIICIWIVKYILVFGVWVFFLEDFKGFLEKIIEIFYNYVVENFDYCVYQNFLELGI